MSIIDSLLSGRAVIRPSQAIRSSGRPRPGNPTRDAASRRRHYDNYGCEFIEADAIRFEHHRPQHPTQQQRESEQP